MSILLLLRDLGVFTIAAFFIQQLITKSDKRKFELFKAELDRQAREYQAFLDGKMELYRAELNFHSYRSTKVYDRQIDVIIESHKMLTALQQNMLDMTPLTQLVLKNFKEEKRRIKALNSYNAFAQYHSDNSILLPQTTADQIECLITDYRKTFWDYVFTKDSNPESENKEQEKRDRMEKRDKLEKINEKVKKNIQGVLDQLSEDFRRFIAAEKISDLLK